MELKEQVIKALPNFNTTWDWLTSEAKQGNELDTLLFQLGSFSGNPSHPLSKLRRKISTNSELEHEDIVTYFSEFGTHFSLPVMAISVKHADVFTLTHNSAIEDSGYRDFFKQHYPDTFKIWVAFLESKGKDPSQYIPIPVHPLNLQHMQETLQPWVHSEDVIQTNASMDVGATISTRTVRPCAANVPYFKLTMPDIQLTGLARGLGRSSAYIAPIVSDLVQQAVKESDGFDHCLRVVGEPFSVCFNTDRMVPLSQYDEEKKKKAQALTSIIRSNPNTQLKENEILLPLAACFGSIGKNPETGALDKPLIVDIMRAAGVRDAQTAKEYFAQYAHTVINGQLGIFANYGIALEAHQQNSFCAFNQNGLLDAAVVQDLADGVQMYKPIIESNPECKKRIQQYAQGEYGNFFYFTLSDTVDKPLEQIIHTTFKTHLFPMATIVSKEFGLSKQELLDIMRTEVDLTLKKARRDCISHIPEDKVGEFNQFIDQIEEGILNKPVFNKAFLSTLIRQGHKGIIGHSERPNPFVTGRY